MLFEIFWDLAISLPAFAIPLRCVVDVELLARFMNASKAAGAQRVAGKKILSLYHTISKQHPMTAYLNGNASDTIFSLGKIKIKLD